MGAVVASLPRNQKDVRYYYGLQKTFCQLIRGRFLLRNAHVLGFRTTFSSTHSKHLLRVNACRVRFRVEISKARSGAIKFENGQAEAYLVEKR